MREPLLSLPVGHQAAAAAQRYRVGYGRRTGMRAIFLSRPPFYRIAARELAAAVRVLAENTLAAQHVFWTSATARQKPIPWGRDFGRPENRDKGLT